MINDIKYTDFYFNFPIRIYDPSTFKKKKNSIIDTEDEDEEWEEPDWVQGWASVRFNDVMGWTDTFAEKTEFDKLVKNGFKNTLVVVRNLGDMVCQWPKKKFERELNEFVKTLASKTTVKIEFPS